MTSGATLAEATERIPDPPDSIGRYLVLLPTLQLVVAPVARAVSESLGPSHPVTAAVALGLLYGTLVTGPLVLLGLWLDGRRTSQPGTDAEDADARVNTTGARGTPPVTGGGCTPPWRWRWPPLSPST